MTQQPRFIRAMHHAAFRAGQWAQILTVADAGERPCYVVQFPDGKTDWWVVDDSAAGYEFRDELPVADRSQEKVG